MYNRCRIGWIGVEGFVKKTWLIIGGILLLVSLAADGFLALGFLAQSQTGVAAAESETDDGSDVRRLVIQRGSDVFVTRDPAADHSAGPLIQQFPDRPAEWTVYAVTDYGEWFRKALDLYIRQSRGL